MMDVCRWREWPGLVAGAGHWLEHSDQLAWTPPTVRCKIDINDYHYLCGFKWSRGKNRTRKYPSPAGPHWLTRFRLSSDNNTELAHRIIVTFHPLPTEYRAATWKTLAIRLVRTGIHINIPTASLYPRQIYIGWDLQSILINKTWGGEGRAAEWWHCTTAATTAWEIQHAISVPSHQTHRL